MTASPSQRSRSSRPPSGRTSSSTARAAIHSCRSSSRDASHELRPSAERVSMTTRVAGSVYPSASASSRETRSALPSASSTRITVGSLQARTAPTTIPPAPARSHPVAHPSGRRRANSNASRDFPTPADPLTIRTGHTALSSSASQSASRCSSRPRPRKDAGDRSARSNPSASSSSHGTATFKSSSTSRRRSLAAIRSSEAWKTRSTTAAVTRAETAPAPPLSQAGAPRPTALPPTAANVTAAATTDQPAHGHRYLPILCPHA